MPEAMKTLGLATPHAWALRAYQDVLVKGAGLVDVLPQIGALLAFALASAAGVAWPRVRLSRTLLGLALVAGAWWPAETAWRALQPLAVVRAQVALAPGDIVLDAGQVVRVLARGAREATVRATSDISGSLPNGALWFLETR